MDIQDMSPTELIEFLCEGKVLPGNDAVEYLAGRARAEGDYRQLKEFLVRHPVLLLQAQRNIETIHYQLLLVPFEPVSRKDAKLYLSGPIKLGHVNVHNDTFGMYPDDLSMPVIVPGRIGSGKSNLNKRLILELLDSDFQANIIIPDLKLEYRDLLQYHPNIKVIDQEHLFINPLKLQPGMMINEHIQFFSKVFTRQNWLLATSENLLIEILQGLYRNNGIYDGSNNWPTLRELYIAVSKRLENQKSFRFRDVLLLLQNRLYPYVNSPIFNCRQGIPDTIWQTGNVVLEVDDGFTDHMYSFLVGYLAGIRYFFNKKNRLSGSKLRTLFVIDEGRILFDANRNTSDFGESYINELSTKTREYGIGYVISSQESASFNQTVRANAYTKFAFPLTDGADRDFVKESYGLDQDQADYLFKLPKHGICVVRYGGYEKPFLLSVPHVDLGLSVTDEEVEQHMADFYRQLRSAIILPEAASTGTQKEVISARAAALLHFLSKEPFTKKSDLASASGFGSKYEVKNAIEELESEELIKSEFKKVSKWGRKATFTVPTQKAIEKYGLKPIPGKGSFEHKLYQHLIAQKLNGRGLNARIEGRLNDSQKSIDVFAWDENGQTTAYEVTLQRKNLIENITQDLAAGAVTVVVVCRNQAELNKAKEMVQALPNWPEIRSKVKFSLISEFFD